MIEAILFLIMYLTNPKIPVCALSLFVAIVHLHIILNYQPFKKHSDGEFSNSNSYVIVEDTQQGW